MAGIYPGLAVVYPVEPLKLSAVLQGVEQVKVPAAVLVRLVLVMVLVVQNALVQLAAESNGLRVIGAAPDGGDLHLGDLFRSGDAPLVAEQVKLKGQSQAGQHRPEGQNAPGPDAEHPEGLLQQHFRQVIAGGSPQQHQGNENQCQGQAGQAAAHGVHENAGQQQSGAEAGAIAEDGAQRLHRQHVPRRFHLTAAVEQQGDHQQHSPGNGVARQGGQTLQLRRLHLAAEGGAIETIQTVRCFHIAQHIHQGRQPGKQHRPRSIAIDHPIQDPADDPLQAVGSQVQGKKQGGHGQNVAGKHGAEHRQAVKGQVGQQDALQPGAQGGGADIFVAGEEKPGQQPGQHRAQQQGQQPGEAGGEPGGLPPQGQGVDEAAVPLVIQVAEHGHGHEQRRQGTVDHAFRGPAQDLIVQPLIIPAAPDKGGNLQG